MQRSYEEHNAAERASGRSRGHYIVDLSRPGHLTDCLRTFQEAVDASPDNWEAAFGACVVLRRGALSLYVVLCWGCCPLLALTLLSSRQAPPDPCLPPRAPRPRSGQLVQQRHG